MTRSYIAGEARRGVVYGEYAHTTGTDSGRPQSARSRTTCHR
jgi:hypothetical protein